MADSRRVFYSENCELAALTLGGFKRIDASLDAAWDSLIKNPYGFPRVESDWYFARFIVTKPYLGVPALLWTFVIEQDGDVIIEDVEEFEGY